MYSRPDPYAAELAAASAPLTEGSISDSDGQPVDTLSEMGEALLEIVRASAVTKGVTLPARQSVYMAPIPADCEQAAVLFSGWNPTPAPDGPTVCAEFRWMAGYSVIITRCTPAVLRGPKGKQVVPMEMMTEAARIASADAEIMLEVVRRLGEIGPDVSVVAQPPSGGLQTVELNIQLLPAGSF